MRLVSLGDLILDVVVHLDGPLVAGDDRPATTRVGAGGQAANVAAWAAALGAESRFVGKRGADAAGELASRELAAYGVELAGPVEGRNGVVVSIASGGERSMASDRGSATRARARPSSSRPGSTATASTSPATRSSASPRRLRRCERSSSRVSTARSSRSTSPPGA